ASRAYEDRRERFFGRPRCLRVLSRPAPPARRRGDPARAVAPRPRSHRNRLSPRAALPRDPRPGVRCAARGRDQVGARSARLGTRAFPDRLRRMTSGTPPVALSGTPRLDAGGSPHTGGGAFLGSVPLLVTKQLSKRFGPVLALDRVDFACAAGEIH